MDSYQPTIIKVRETKMAKNNTLRVYHVEPTAVHQEAVVLPFVQLIRLRYQTIEGIIDNFTEEQIAEHLKMASEHLEYLQTQIAGFGIAKKEFAIYQSGIKKMEIIYAMFWKKQQGLTRDDMKWKEHREEPNEQNTEA